MAEFRAKETPFGAATVFRVVAEIDVTQLVGRLPRRERWVLLLVDGKRTLTELAHLTHRSELDVGSTLARLLQWGYIEPIHENLFQ